MKKQGPIMADGKASPKAPAPGAAAAAYLTHLGERVRGHRARRGMTRRALAQASAISERYLAQLEHGEGNISILLLRQVARALGLPLSELTREGGEQSVELSLLVEFFDRLPAEKQREVLRSVMDRAGAPQKKDRRVALIGLRGAGKTTLGDRLAKRMGVPFIRLGAEIEKLAGMTVNEIYSLSGQAAYRRFEHRALADTIEKHPRAVIETGGSLVAEPATFGLLLASCFTVWVKTSPEQHMARGVAQGDYRPMADNADAMADLRRILAERDPFYRRADAVLDTSGRDIEDCAEELASLCERAVSEPA
jgi:XRE family aerobic/anaerobic benzoate catabolism transcriptional regulator